MYIRFVWDSLSRIQKNPETRTTSYFLLLLLVFSLYQLFLGVKEGAALLLIDALYTVFHVFCSFLTASEVTGRSFQRSFPYSYGFGRLEVLLDFSISLFAVFVYMFIVAESVLEFLAPDLFGHGHGQSGHNSQTAFPLSVIAVSIVAKVVSYALSSRNFGSSGRVSRYSVSAHEHKHLTQTSQVKDLFKEGLVSISVFLCLFNQYCHFIDLDILEGIICGLVAIYCIWPLFRSSGLVLLQSVPVTELAPLDRARREILGINGVVEVLEQKYWVQTPGDFVLSARLKVKRNSNEDQILSEARATYNRIATNITIELDADGTDSSSHTFNTSVLVQ